MDENIEVALRQALLEFEALGIKEQIDFDKLYLYSLVTHSTAIEGSTVTEIENALMFDDDIAPSGHTLTEQLMNLDLKRAYERAAELVRPDVQITVATLKALSAAVMKNTGSKYSTALGSFDSAAGDLRLVNVSAGRGGRSYLAYQKVSARLEDFCAWLNKARASAGAEPIGIYKLSFEAHYRLVTIHPWADGNGRTCRLLMNALQVERGLLPSIVKKEHKAAYITALAEAQEQADVDVFVDFMLQELLGCLQQYIEEFKDSMAK